MRLDIDYDVLINTIYENASEFSSHEFADIIEIQNNDFEFCYKKMVQGYIETFVKFTHYIGYILGYDNIWKEPDFCDLRLEAYLKLRDYSEELATKYCCDTMITIDYSLFETLFETVLSNERVCEALIEKCRVK